MNKLFKMSDSSGIIGLVNAKEYDSFVKEDWELNDLLFRFKTETNRGNCIVWNTGYQNLVSARVTYQKTNSKSFREILAKIKVTDHKVYLVNYDDLSMSAQFEDQTLPSKWNEDLYIELSNGTYEVNIRQLFNPEKYDWENPPNPCFEIVFIKSNLNPINNFEKVIWQESS